MQKIKAALFLLFFLYFIFHSQASRFSTNGGFGNSTVGGIGADYATLYDAATDFNSYTSGCQGNWTLWINSDLVETNACPFGNTVGANTVILRPTLGGTKTVKFTNYDSPGINGHLIIGSIQTTSKDILKKTDNFIINGSPEDSSESQNLVLCNAGSIANTRIIHVFGDCDNITIKNCYVINTTPTATPVSAISFTSRRTTGSVNAATPDFGSIDHCILIGPSSNLTGYGIEFNNSGTIPAGQAQSGMSVTRCLINARNCGIFMNINSGGTLSSNTIRLNQPNFGYLSQGIFHSSSNNATGWTLIINGNVFDKMTTGNTTAGVYGLVAIDATGAPASGTVTYTITNNMISAEQWGFPVTANPIAYWAIRGGSNLANYNIYHNSIRLPYKSSLSGLSTGNCNAIALTGSTYSGIANIKNNILYLAQPGAAAIYKNGSGTFNCDANVIYTCSTSTVGRIGTVCYSTFADWTSSGNDIHGQSIDPDATSPGKWVSPTDLHFDNMAIPLQPVPRLSVLTTDIDGDSRDVNCWPGADELPGITVPINLSRFEEQ